MQAPRLTPSLWGQLVLLSFLWGISFVFMKLVVQELPPLTTVAARMILSAILMVPLMPLLGMAIPRDGRIWLLGMALGSLINMVPFFLITWAQQTIPSGVAAIINASTPLFVVAIAPFFFRDERLTLPRVGGVLLGMIGVVTLIGPNVLRGLDGYTLSLLAVLLGSMCYAAGAIWTRRLSHMNSWTLTFASCAGAAITSSVLALAIDHPWQYRPSLQVWGALAVLALGATVLATVLYVNVIRGGGATSGALATQLVPLSAAGLGAVIFGDRLGLNAVLAFALIFAGFALVDGRILRRLRPQETERPTSGRS